ncbi:hypothetical protein FACS1894172_07390 [Spirochaetia bacterium]|nr:hypothetical protein FACS1894164_02120 [Spirochaetia bacterium]GHU31831.1 hypothetical protein FACS1894172_07390 [Spirochaetia bacterium]
MKLFSGRSALVIGGTGGIGRKCAEELGSRGAFVTVHGGFSPERLESTLESIRNAGGDADGFLFPVENPEASEYILTKVPDPDILVCAWGPFLRGALETMTGSDWSTMVNLNLAFPGSLVSGVLPAMIAKQWGRILLFGGTGTDTIRGFSTTALYSAAKTGLGVLAKSVARTASAYSITCNVLCPGLVDTEYSDPAAICYNHKKNPDHLPLYPEDIARVACAVLENPSINGAVIPADRGLVL